MATGISTSYVLVVMLSWFFLDEGMNWMKIGSARMTPGSVTLLSWQGKKLRTEEAKSPSESERGLETEHTSNIADRGSVCNHGVNHTAYC